MQVQFTSFFHTAERNFLRLLIHVSRGINSSSASAASSLLRLNFKFIATEVAGRPTGVEKLTAEH